MALTKITTDVITDNSITSAKVGSEFITTAAIGSNATENADWAYAQIFTLTPSQSTTLNIINPIIGIQKSFIITGSGNLYTITFNVNGVAGVFNLISGEYDDTAGIKNYLNLIYVNTNEFWYTISQIAV